MPRLTLRVQYTGVRSYQTRTSVPVYATRLGLVIVFKRKMLSRFVLYCIVVLNPKIYDGARVLEASGRPMLVIGRS